jgi:type VI secretion system secreted protein VgrG
MSENRFYFEVTANDGDTSVTPNVPPTKTSFTVLSFEGEEEISQPFEYRLVLALNASTIDFEKVVNQDAVLTMELRDNSRPAPVLSTTIVRGIVASFRVTRALDNNQELECEAVLVPKLWRLGMSHRSRVFQNLTVEEVIDKVLQQSLTPLTQTELDAAKLLGGVSSGTDKALTKSSDTAAGDYEFRWGAPPSFDYPKREFIMQYQETDLAFVQRLMEDIGLYYFFDDGQLVITDTKDFPGAPSTAPNRPQKASAPAVEGPKGVRFERPGANGPLEDRIYRFVRNESVVPKTVSVRDQDYESFSEFTSKNQSTGTDGDYARVGTYTEHGHYSVADRGWVGDKGKDLPLSNTDAETKRTTRLERIAVVRAEELEARRRRGEGYSNVTRLQAGHVFTLSNHFLSQFDGDYLVTKVHHRYGMVPMKVTEEIEVVGLGKTTKHTIERTEENLVYENEFTCLPVGVQYRPPRVTPIPRVPGIMTARVKEIDGDEHAYLDAEGRYRVRFPFDPDPEAGPNRSPDVQDPSRPMRLAQPYAGQDYGMHFPNRKDVEMVFACLDGDPNRPLGLSVVPTPWKHSPVPNAGLGLGSQNPTTGSSATPGGDYTNAVTNSDDSHTYSFEKTKNVIRTHVGHQLVMDDADGGANVGITLQVGSSKSTSSTGAVTDKYWGSKVELGGYRHLSVLERILGIASTAVGYFRNAFTRDFPGMASDVLGIMASQVTTDNYADDTYGSTTPVGVNIWTNKDVRVTGKDGVHITSPNLFGMFSTSLMPGDDASKNQYFAEAIAKFVINTVWQEVINGTADELMETREDEKKYKTNPHVNPKVKAAFKWRANFKEQRVSALFFTLLQRSGVNISSMGELKMSSLQSTSIAAGQGGLALKSFGDIEQKADLGVEISSHQGITLTTKGRPYKGKGIFKALRKLGDSLTNPALKVFLGKMESKFSNAMNDPNEMFPIELNNDDGDIFLHTGGPEQKGEGDIMAHVEGKGDVKAFANRGLVHLWSTGLTEKDSIILETGSRGGLKDKKAIAPLDSGGSNPASARLALNTRSMSGFSVDKVDLSVGDKYDGGDNARVTIEDSQIEIKCGKSSIVMKKNGDITLKGANITLEGTGDVNAKGQNITSAARANHKSTGLNVAAEARAKVNMKGSLAIVEGSGMSSVKGSIIKIG